tara:strand:+ start:211 stop:465 length:255 start_codon:yes stop_codon:yes gene_type:complete
VIKLVTVPPQARNILTNLQSCSLDDQKKLFKIFSLKDSFAELKDGIPAISNIFGIRVEEMSYEEFPFENFTNMTFGNRLILLQS